MLVCTDARWPDARCELLAGAQVLYNGKSFISPAAAAREIRGGSGNAWYFWRVEGGPMLKTLREQLLEGVSEV